MDNDNDKDKIFVYIKTGNEHHYILNNCSNIFKNIKLNYFIGEGTFGEVYGGTGVRKKDDKVINIAVKFSTGDFNLDKMTHEVDLSYAMGNFGIGPKVYDAFFTSYTDNSPKKASEHSEEKLTQVIIMESFPTDALGYLYEEDSITKRKIVIKEMVELIKKLTFFHDISCFDIKPNNFVVREGQHDITVKMIDFGLDFCKKTPIYKNDVFELIKFQLFITLPIPKEGVYDRKMEVRNMIKYYDIFGDLDLDRLKKIIDEHKKIDVFHSYFADMIDKSRDTNINELISLEKKFINDLQNTVLRIRTDLAKITETFEYGGASRRRRRRRRSRSTAVRRRRSRSKKKR